MEWHLHTYRFTPEHERTYWYLKKVWLRQYEVSCSNAGRHQPKPNYNSLEHCVRLELAQSSMSTLT